MTQKSLEVGIVKSVVSYNLVIMASLEKILEKLQNLSETSLQEVLDFIENLESRNRTDKPLSSPTDNNDSRLIELKKATEHYQNGITKLQLGEYQQAITEFNYALQIYPNYSEAYYYRGKSQHKLNDKESAIADFKTAAKLYCENNLADEMANWTVFELGESNREEAIDYLLQYFEANRSYDEKRLAASAINKLAKSFKTSCEIAIPHLLKNLSDPAPQVRQYILKALDAISLPDDAILKIKEIVENDDKDYNRNLAQRILKKYDH